MSNPANNTLVSIKAKQKAAPFEHALARIRRGRLSKALALDQKL
jgi:hypothetical protein